MTVITGINKQKTLTTPPEIRNFSSDQISEIYNKQRHYFDSGSTRDYRFRKDQLQKLKKLIKNSEAEILQAMKDDFGKSTFEAYASEVGFFYEEVNLTLDKLREWMEPVGVSSPITTWPSRSYYKPVPKGVTLIISPWNYPFNLLMVPLVAAMAAGNTVVVKPPEQTPHISKLLEKLLVQNFDEQYIAVVQGEGKEVVPALINNHRFNHVFFTGSTAVGKKIAEMAAPHLTPVTLELGGKSPCIVDATANIKVAARRIAFGKWLNAGQTCVAPDYLLLHKGIKDEFIKEFEKTTLEFYGKNPLENKDYTSIVNRDRFLALQELMHDGEILFGGQMDEKNLRISPTLIDGVTLDDKIMQEEIFGPLLPILTYTEISEAKRIIAANPYPLSFYVFTKSRKVEKAFIDDVQFGGGAVNNAIVHLANPELPFGGVGTSGFGSYHGKSGFDTFSHEKSIMKSATWFDLKQKYPPYSSFVLRLIKWVMG